MKEQLLNIIESHNATIKTLKESNLHVPYTEVFTIMTIWHKLACEGFEITKSARNNGINAKVNMQTGEIHIENPT